jgi:hypothetical protein
MRNFINMVTETLTEAKVVRFNDRRLEALVYENPTRSDIVGLIARMPVIRGLTDGQKVYVWDANEFTHAMIIQIIKLGTDPNFNCNIYDFGKMFIIMDHVPTSYKEPGGEWKNHPSMVIANEIKVYAEQFDELSAVTAFNRMVGSRTQSASETNPASE